MLTVFTPTPNPPSPTEASSPFYFHLCFVCDPVSLAGVSCLSLDGTLPTDWLLTSGYTTETNESSSSSNGQLLIVF